MPSILVHLHNVVAGLRDAAQQTPSAVDTSRTKGGKARPKIKPTAEALQSSGTIPLLPHGDRALGFVRQSFLDTP